MAMARRRLAIAIFLAVVGVRSACAELRIATIQVDETPPRNLRRQNADRTRRRPTRARRTVRGGPAMRPDSFVCMAAYGDYGPGVIGTAGAHSQGGFETGAESRASLVLPRSEAVLLPSLEALLK